jgi:hypothetical protein
MVEEKPEWLRKNLGSEEKVLRDIYTEARRSVQGSVWSQMALEQSRRSSSLLSAGT